MRTAIASLLLATLAAAQDGAPELFYKAFWLEQAEGKTVEAEEIYWRIVAQFPKAPEAPRALLGAIRIRAGNGAPVGPLVERLVAEYPGASEEIARARKIAEAGRDAFDPTLHEDDAPVERKLKGLWYVMSAGRPIASTDLTFLVDVGVQAHPLLRQLLRHSEYAVAKLAAEVLLRQATAGSRALVAAALADDAVLFKAAILDALRQHETADPAIVNAVARLLASPAPRLRSDAAATIGDLVFGAPEPKDAAYAALTALLRGDDPELAATALNAWRDEPTRVPDACAQALVAHLEAGGHALEPHYAMLLWFSVRPGLRERVEKILLAHGPVHAKAPLPEEVGAFAARVAFALVDAGKTSGSDTTMFAEAAASSSAVAAQVLIGALQRGDKTISMAAWFALAQGVSTNSEAAARLGPAIEGVRRATLYALYSGDAAREAAGRDARERLGLGDDFAFVDEFLAQRKAGLSPAVISWDLLAALGPEKAGRLVRHARDEAEAALLLEQGLRFLGKDRRGGEGIPFFEQVLPRVGPGAVEPLAEVARYPNLKPLLARVLLDATREEWGWSAPEEKDAKGRVSGSSRRYDAREQPGPYLWVHMGVGWGCFDPSLVEGMPARVLDPREEVAKTAATVAAKSEGATGALLRALESPYAAVRGVAVYALAGRGARGAEAVDTFAQRNDLGAEDRVHVRDALEAMGGEAAAAICRARLATRKDAWAHLWRVYRDLAPERATDLALDEAMGDGEAAFRDVALDILTQVGDARRIDVFRKILTGKESEARVRKVVETVADQYLIELGPETLRHLRSPDDGIRDLATKAIERLKFYADAKRTFESGDAAPGVR